MVTIMMMATMMMVSTTKVMVTIMRRWAEGGRRLGDKELCLRPTIIHCDQTRLHFRHQHHQHHQIIDIINIINTRPMLPYGRQGLAGSSGKDTIRRYILVCSQRLASLRGEVVVVQEIALIPVSDGPG